MNLRGLETIYTTRLGQQVTGDSRLVLAELADESIDLIVTSPPFALLRQKSYGNEASQKCQMALEFVELD